MSQHTRIETAHDCDAIQALVPDYAFGLTDADETRLVESNLPYCPEAASQLADFRRIQAEMREGVPQIEPPPALGERLMAQMSAPEVTSAKPRRRALNLMWLAAAAVIALVLTNAYWLVRLNRLEQTQDNPISQITGDNSDALIWAASSDMRRVRLPASENIGDATAILMWNAESKIGLLYAEGFPELAVGKTYQLWLTRGEKLVSAGTFRVDEEGNSALLFHITEAIDEYTWARITEEPENGSTEPTGIVVAVGEL